MNWKIIVGILIIFGGTKEFFTEMSDYNNGVTHYNPIYAELGCATFIFLGLYLIYKGSQQKKTFK
jgi:hypothetical protein